MRVVCQSDVQLDEESRQGLLCQIGESPQIDATYEENCVACDVNEVGFVCMTCHLPSCIAELC